MKIGSATFYNFLAKSPVEICEELQKNGVDVVEVMYEYPHLISEADAKNLRELGLDYSLHCPFTEKSFAHPDPEFRRFQSKMVKKSLAIAEKIGADCYIMHGGSLPLFYSILETPITRRDFYGIFVEEFGRMFARANDSGVKILMENLGTKGQLGDNYEDVTWLLKRLPDIGFCLDVSHAVMAGGKELLNKYINSLEVDHVHITDSIPGDDKHWAVGMGQLPIKETLQKLKAKGYKGKVIFEGLTLADTLESVKKLREMVK